MMADREAANPTLGTLHPSFEALLAHHDGGLAAAEAQRIEEHCARCRSCREQRDGLARFLAPAEAEVPLDEADAAVMWDHIATSRAAGPSAPEAEDDGEPGAQPVLHRRQMRRLQGLAAGLLATTLLFAIAWFVAHRQAAQLADAELNVPVESLEAATFLRGGAGARTLSPGAVLILTPARPPADVDHTVEILTTDGETVWSAQGLRPIRDNFQLRLPRNLPRGETLRLRLFLSAPGPQAGAEVMACRITIAGSG